MAVFLITTSSFSFLSSVAVLSLVVIGSFIAGCSMEASTWSLASFASCATDLTERSLVGLTLFSASRFSLETLSFVSSTGNPRILSLLGVFLGLGCLAGGLGLAKGRLALVDTAAVEEVGTLFSTASGDLVLVGGSPLSVTVADEEAAIPFGVTFEDSTNSSVLDGFGLVEG